MLSLRYIEKASKASYRRWFFSHVSQWLVLFVANRDRIWVDCPSQCLLPTMVLIYSRSPTWAYHENPCQGVTACGWRHPTVRLSANDRWSSPIDHHHSPMTFQYKIYEYIKWEINTIKIIWRKFWYIVINSNHKKSTETYNKSRSELITEKLSVYLWYVGYATLKLTLVD